MTLAEWAAADVDGELVDGLLVEEEMPSKLHERIVAWLIVALGRWAIPRDAAVYGSEHKLAIGPRKGRNPDVTVWIADEPYDPRATMDTTPPDIAIEVVTPTPRDAKRDRVEKPVEYARFGVRWYWIVDPSLRTLEIFELRDGAYVRARGASDGSLRPPGCRGLSLDLDAMWKYGERTSVAKRPRKR
jgi:Uma2 family endonuclease